MQRGNYGNEKEHIMKIQAEKGLQWQNLEAYIHVQDRREKKTKKFKKTVLETRGNQI